MHYWQDTTISFLNFTVIATFLGCHQTLRLHTAMPAAPQCQQSISMSHFFAGLLMWEMSFLEYTSVVTEYGLALLLQIVWACICTVNSFFYSSRQRHACNNINNNHHHPLIHTKHKITTHKLSVCEQVRALNFLWCFFNVNLMFWFRCHQLLVLLIVCVSGFC